MKEILLILGILSSVGGYVGENCQPITIETLPYHTQQKGDIIIFRGGKRDYFLVDDTALFPGHPVPVEYKQILACRR